MLPPLSPRAISGFPRARFPLMLVFVGLGAAVVATSAAQPHASAVCGSDAVEAAPQVAPAVAADALAGIWWRYEAGVEGDPVRFYYFHGNGKGLYRYGRVGLNNTHSFDYAFTEDVLSLRFRKSGEEHRVSYTVTRADGRDVLVLTGDPEEPGATRYFRDRAGPIDPHGEGVPVAAPGTGSVLAADPGTPPSGHMWIDHRKYATGGEGFSFYQFRASGIDGRGVGWFHRGDFDDWSTEAFTYRIVGDRLALDFSLAGQRATTSMAVSDTRPRVLTLADDPRDFWHAHHYLDAGPSFGAATPVDQSTADLRLIAALAQSAPR